MSVGCDSSLVAFVLLPRNISRMMTLNQDRPFRHWFLVARRLSCTAIDNRCARLRFTECIRASIKRIRQQLENGVIDGQIPNRSSAGFIEDSHRQFYALPSEPQQDLTHTAQLSH